MLRLYSEPFNQFQLGFTWKQLGWSQYKMWLLWKMHMLCLGGRITKYLTIIMYVIKLYIFFMWITPIDHSGCNSRVFVGKCVIKLPNSDQKSSCTLRLLRVCGSKVAYTPWWGQPCCSSGVQYMGDCLIYFHVVLFIGQSWLAFTGLPNFAVSVLEEISIDKFFLHSYLSTLIICLYISVYKKI